MKATIKRTKRGGTTITMKAGRGEDLRGVLEALAGGPVRTAAPTGENMGEACENGECNRYRNNKGVCEKCGAGL